MSSSAIGPNSNQYTVDLHGMNNGQCVSVSLGGVQDNAGADFNVAVPMGVLFGDVTGNAVVTNTDVSAVKAQVAAPVTSSNFRNDVNANGICQ